MRNREHRSLLSLNEIKKIIPHREPFLFLDAVEIIEPGRKGKGYFTARKEMELFKGHFPGNPVLPGVIMVEAAAQVGACVLLALDEFKGKTAYFAGIEDFKFKRIVRPDEVLEIDVEIANMRRNFGKGRVHGKVNEELAFEGTLSFFIA